MSMEAVTAFGTRSWRRGGGLAEGCEPALRVGELGLVFAEQGERDASGRGLGQLAEVDGAGAGGGSGGRAALAGSVDALLERGHLALRLLLSEGRLLLRPGGAHPQLRTDAVEVGGEALGVADVVGRVGALLVELVVRGYRLRLQLRQLRVTRQREVSGCGEKLRLRHCNLQGRPE
jgi:hypothetical protein